jgi:hypothetical protein
MSPEGNVQLWFYKVPPTSLDSVASERLLASMSRLGDPLSLSSSVSAFLSLVSRGEETEEVFRRLLLGS